MTMAQVNSSTIKIGDADKFGRAIQSYIEDFNTEAAKAVAKSIQDVSKEAVKQLHSTSPKGKGRSRGKYASGWTVKNVKVARGVGLTEVVIHNKNAPGLAHLLEFKHDYVSPAGKTTKSTPKPHIQKVDDWVEAELPRRIQQNIQNS